MRQLSSRPVEKWIYTGMKPSTRIAPLAVMASVPIGVGTASSAVALVDNCAGPAANGCYTATHTYLETRSMKSGGRANYICSFLRDGASSVGNCVYNGTFYRGCNYTQDLRYGAHYGSSNQWTVDGRDATASDANVC